MLPCNKGFTFLLLNVFPEYIFDIFVFGRGKFYSF